MYNIPQVRFKVIKKDQFTGEFEIGPLVGGFGHSVGSSLRRTLASATKGAAITKVMIDGVTHQFTTLDGVKDDILQIVLSLKKIKFIKHTDEPIEVSIDATGPGDLTAGQIETPSGIEVVNKDFVITHLNDAKTKFKAKLTVESGYGYKELDEREVAPHGTLLLDASFSPVINVEYKVSPTRVGRETDFDMLTITVKTDGSVDSEVAVRNASKVLKEFFYKVQTGEDYNETEDANLEISAKVTDKKDSKLPADEILIDEIPIFPTRTINALKKAGVKTLGDLAAKREDELLKVRNLGEKSIREILAFLEKEKLR